MNKYMQKLALYLIGRRLRKMEKAALKNIRTNSKTGNAKVRDNVPDPRAYRKLLTLRSNIEGINGPWQGTFGLVWERMPKNKKYVKPFPKEEVVVPEEAILSEEDQRWADMPLDEFLEELKKEEDS